jgi:hypothetical protein
VDLEGFFLDDEDAVSGLDFDCGAADRRAAGLGGSRSPAKTGFDKNPGGCDHAMWIGTGHHAGAVAGGD